MLSQFHPMEGILLSVKFQPYKSLNCLESYVAKKNLGKKIIHSWNSALEIKSSKKKKKKKGNLNSTYIVLHPLSAYNIFESNFHLSNYPFIHSTDIFKPLLKNIDESDIL